MATHSSILAWKAPLAEEPGGPQGHRATVHGVRKSWTQLSDFHFHTVESFSVVNEAEVDFFFLIPLLFL